MTIDEKLQHFYDETVEECRIEAETTVEEHKAHLAEELEKHQKIQQETADAALKAETENASREVNKVLSSELLTLKRNWTLRQNEYRDKLFVEVKDLLDEFMSSPEYDEFLCKRIREAKEFAGDDEIFIYLTEGDSARIQALSLRTGVGLLISEKPFLGGIQARIPSKNILIDNSFLSAMETLKREFKFDGGLKNNE